MTNNISSGAANRRENARQTDGKFGHQHHSEAEVALPEMEEISSSREAADFQHEQLMAAVNWPSHLTNVDERSAEHSDVLREVEFAERDDRSGICVSVTQRASEEDGLTSELTVRDKHHNLLDSRIFPGTDLGRRRLIAATREKLTNVQDAQSARRARMDHLRRLTTRDIQIEERRIESQRRVIDLLSVHDVKDQLASKDITSVTLTSFNGVAEVETVHGEGPEKAMFTAAHDIIRDADLSFQQLSLADNMYAEGESTILFDATGNPGDTTRAELEDQLVEFTT